MVCFFYLFSTLFLYLRPLSLSQLLSFDFFCIWCVCVLFARFNSRLSVFTLFCFTASELLRERPSARAKLCWCWLCAWAFVPAVFLFALWSSFFSFGFIYYYFGITFVCNIFSLSFSLSSDRRRICVFAKPSYHNSMRFVPLISMANP